jgi:hypothetical protein
MTDEHLMRCWTDAHSEFSSDLDRGLLRLGHFLARRLQRRETIGRAYRLNRPAETEMSATARAALAGVLACVATTALLVSVAALANNAAMPADSPIVAHAYLA